MSRPKTKVSEYTNIELVFDVLPIFERAFCSNFSF